MRGLLLVNLGTPDAPTTGAVRRYLREFLSDPRVIDINPVGRSMLVNLVILPTRPKASAELYRNIWTDEGSPLLIHSRDLRDKVEKLLGEEWKVELAMRYGNPSIPSALDRFQEANILDIVVMPLYPQNASSSTGSSIERVYDEAKSRWNVPMLSIVPEFYDEDEFIEAFADNGRPLLAEMEPDHVVFSFHGLPERHMRKGDPSGSHCLEQEHCCAAITEKNRHCYRAQCFSTARRIAAALKIPEDKYTTCFQSRLGRTPWIQPYFDEVLPKLGEKGAKKVLVFSPAFVADCLETLEEIGIRAKEQWTEECGGEEIRLVPSLNSSDRWASLVADLARRTGA